MQLHKENLKGLKMTPSHWRLFHQLLSRADSDGLLDATQCVEAPEFLYTELVEAKLITQAVMTYDQWEKKKDAIEDALRLAAEEAAAKEAEEGIREMAHANGSQETVDLDFLDDYAEMHRG